MKVDVEEKERKGVGGYGRKGGREVEGGRKGKRE